MAPFEIYLAQYPWRGCNDSRPWLLIQPSANGGFACFGISGQDYEYDAFPLEMTDPEFPATGLRKTSYIHDNGPMSDLPLRETF